jgi:two-component system, LytTR family, response regulator AlgR
LVAEKQIAAIERSDDGQYSVRMRDSEAVLQVSRRHATELLRRVKGGS